MKKVWSRILALAMCVVTLFGVAGCRSDRDENDDRPIQLKVSFFQAGYGDGWMKALEKMYEDEHPDVNVIVDGDYGMEATAKNAIENQDKIQPSDIYTVNYYPHYLGYIRGKNGKPLIEDLSDLYDDEVENGKTMNDLVEPSAMEYVTVDGKNYGVPFSGAAVGFAYNRKMFALNGWTAPETMEEFYELCAKIKAKGIHPLTYCGSLGGYWTSILPLWFCQYQGLEKFKEFYRYENPEVFQMEGRLKAYQEMAKIVSDTNIIDPLSKSYDNLLAQQAWIKGEVAMVLTGSWVKTEMKEFLQYYPSFEMGFFPAPFLNADKTDVNGDPANIVNMSNGDRFVIPVNAKNKETAKDFLLFMCEQRSLETFVKETGGTPRPFKMNKTDWSELDAFGQDIMKIWQNALNIFPFSTATISLEGKISDYLAEKGNPLTYLQLSTSATDAQVRAQFLFEEDYRLACTILK